MRAFAWFVAVAVGAAAFAGGFGDHTWWLNPASDHSLFRWASASAALVGAACASTLWKDGEGARHLLLAATLAFISVDYAVGLHERLAADLDLRAIEHADWQVALLVAFTLLLGALLVLLVLQARGEARGGTVRAGTALLVAALAARFVGALLDAADVLPGGAFRTAGQAAMHALATAGWILVAAGLLAFARGRKVD